MAAVHLFDVAVDVAQVILLLLEVLLRPADDEPTTTSDSGMTIRATRVITQLMESIMTSTPTTVTPR